MIPPIYAITLEDTHWKTAALLRHFDPVKLTLINGFNGMTLGLRPCNPYSFDGHGHEEYIHLAQVGCAMSHMLALKTAIHDGHPEFIIIEDDAAMVDGFSEKWEQLRVSIPSNVDVVQLEYLHAGDKPQRKINDHVWHCWFPFCTAAIWWRQSAAKAAIRMMLPLDASYDLLLMKRVFPFLNHAVSVPPLFTQRTVSGDWPSTIANMPKL